MKRAWRMSYRNLDGNLKSALVIAWTIQMAVRALGNVNDIYSAVAEDYEQIIQISGEANAAGESKNAAA